MQAKELHPIFIECMHLSKPTKIYQLHLYLFYIAHKENELES